MTNFLFQSVSKPEWDVPNLNFTILGITKTSLKNKIKVWYDSEEADEAFTLLQRRGNKYSFNELCFLVGFMLSGHDACVMDNSEDYTPLEIYNAEQAHNRYDAAVEQLKLLGEK